MIQTKQKEYRIKLEYYKDALQAGREVIKNCKCKLGYGTDMVATHQNYESGYEFKAVSYTHLMHHLYARLK